MNAKECISRFVNKTVPFRFRGKDLSFSLSHALFSSFDIDEGTRLLLKSIAQNVDLAAVGSILDVGCGVGVLGACLKAAAPHTRVRLQDRDSLAAAFAMANCEQNGMKDIETHCCLGFHDVEGPFDLIVSNLPAKAGLPVLEGMFSHAAALASPRGRAAIVIVSPLARLAREQMKRLDCEALYEEETRDYLVIHFRPRVPRIESREERESLDPYIRAHGSYSFSGRAYPLETCFSLPDFDTLSHRLELSMEVLTGLSNPRNVLFWNPGQGHLASWLPARNISLASRDSLELSITNRNLTIAGHAPITAIPSPSERELRDLFPPESFDLLVADPRPVPRVPWQEELALSSLSLLRPGGMLFVSGSSTEIHRFTEAVKGFRMLQGKKQYGNRAAIFRRA